MRIVHSAIKFFFTYTVKRDWGTLKMIRGERRRSLPDVLTVEEVQTLIAKVRPAAKDWNDVLSRRF